MSRHRREPRTFEGVQADMWKADELKDDVNELINRSSSASSSDLKKLMPHMMKGFIAMGVLVHVLLMFAVFDIYFVSPVYKGMTPHNASNVAPANRVVLFVADGLPFDTLNTDAMSRTPFLAEMCKSGIAAMCHTRVPTESRPGHVAMLGGFYEDPGAITTGWQRNPVTFDSVINESSRAWCWGSPDIVNLFKTEGASHIFVDSYEPEMQDFSGAVSPAELDIWVFEKVRGFLQSQDRFNCTTLCQRGSIFFLHLLGMDTAGHSIKPTSEKYGECLKEVDKGIKEMHDIFEDFFNDGKTAYIFTADHGMTPWGSHGAGSPLETEIPFIAWGAGIPVRGPLDLIDQADIAPLMSALLGNNFPINSMGTVPLHLLNMSAADKAHVLLANARQLGEQYMMRHEKTEESTIDWLFRPWATLPEKKIVQDKLNLNSHLLRLNLIEESIHESHTLINLFKEGIRYYGNYYRAILLTTVTFGFIGWIIFLFSVIEDLNTSSYHSCKKWVAKHVPVIGPVMITCFVLIIIILMLPFIMNLPWKYIVYCIFPVVTWCFILLRLREGVTLAAVLVSLKKKTIIYYGLYYILGVELLIFSFMHPVYLSILFIFLAWQERVSSEPSSKYCCTVQIALGLCPLVMDMQTQYVIFLQLVSCALFVGYFAKEMIIFDYTNDKHIIHIQLSLLIVAFINGIMVDISIRLQWGLLLFNQIISWAIVPLALFYPVTTSTRLQIRVISAVIGLATPYVLMGVGYENIYLFFFIQHLLNWMKLTHKRLQSHWPNTSELYVFNTANPWNFTFTNSESVKQCFYLLSCIMLSFFGPGNKASMNAFDPMWTRCFVTVFRPWMMTLLIIMKVAIPMVIVMCVFYCILFMSRSKMRNNFLIILFLCDLMVIQLMYHVKNIGSWLDIGLSLSYFLVANATTIIILILYEIASFFMSNHTDPVKLRKYLVRQLQRNFFDGQPHPDSMFIRRF